MIKDDARHRRCAGRLHPRHQPVPKLDDLSCTGHPDSRRRRQAFPRRDRLALVAWIDSLAGTRQINKFKPLMTRVEPDQVQRMIEQSKREYRRASENAADEPMTTRSASTISPKSTCVLPASKRPKRSKARTSCCALTLDLGDSSRKVFAGIKAAYEPAELEPVATSSLWPISRRARCALACPRAWCWRRARAARIFSCCRPTMAQNRACASSKH